MPSVEDACVTVVSTVTQDLAPGYPRLTVTALARCLVQDLAAISTGRLSLRVEDTTGNWHRFFCCL